MEIGANPNEKVLQYELLGIRTCLADKVGEFKNRWQRQYKLYEPKPTSPAT